MFRSKRKRQRSAELEPAETADESRVDSASDSGAETGPSSSAAGKPDGAGKPDSGKGFHRGEGPLDITELTGADAMARIDFGAVKVPGVDGMSVSLEVDESSQQVVAVTVAVGEGAVQLQPFAAPRSGGFWPEVRGELMKGITASGGTVDVTDGPFGAQLVATVPAQAPDGRNVMQTVRFVGVEGPRWLLRGVMLGQAAVDPRGAELFEDILRGCVVERGSQPMAPGDLLPLKVPVADEEGEGDDAEESDAFREPLDPFERGPEITEIR